MWFLSCTCTFQKGQTRWHWDRKTIPSPLLNSKFLMQLTDVSAKEIFWIFPSPSSIYHSFCKHTVTFFHNCFAILRIAGRTIASWFYPGNGLSEYVWGVYTQDLTQSLIYSGNNLNNHFQCVHTLFVQHDLDSSLTSQTCSQGATWDKEQAWGLFFACITADF